MRYRILHAKRYYASVMHRGIKTNLKKKNNNNRSYEQKEYSAGIYEVKTGEYSLSSRESVDGRSIKDIKHMIAPVSYTHLDVYKRQVCVCARAREYSG